MLKITRTEGQTIHLINDEFDIVIHVESFGNGKQVKLGIEAPQEVTVLRGELLEEIHYE